MNFLRNIKKVTANYTALVFDDTIFVDTSAGDVTITLPPALSVAEKLYTIKGTDFTNQIFITGNGSETIDGNATAEIFLEASSVTFHSDGIGWFQTNNSSVAAVNFYNTSSSLISPREIVGAGNFLKFIMTTAQLLMSFTTGNRTITAAEGTNSTSSVLNSVSDTTIVSNGTSTATRAQTVTGVTDTFTDGSKTSNTTITATDVILTGAERVVLSGTPQDKMTVLSVNTTLVVGIHSAIFADASGGAFTIDMPASPEAGDKFRIGKDASYNQDVTIQGNGNNIESQPLYILNTPFESIELQFNGTFWMKFGAQ